MSVCYRTVYSLLLLFAFGNTWLFSYQDPPPAGGNNHLEMARGYGVEGAFSQAGLDSVNTFNGNMILNVPLGPSFKVGTFQYRFNLIYNSKAWEFYNRCDSDGDCSDMAVPNPFCNAGLGWKLSFGELFEPRSADLDPEVPWPNHSNTQWLYVAPDGTRYQIGPDVHRDDGFLYSRGGQHVRAKLTTVGSSDNMKIEFPNGQIHHFQRRNWGDCLAEDRCWKLVKMEDLFENYVEFDYEGTTQVTKIEIEDSFNRKHIVDFESLGISSQPGAYRVRIAEIILNDHMPSDKDMVFEFDYRSERLAREYPHAWGGTNVSHLTVPLLDTIEVPDGSEYAFSYNTSGDRDSGILTDYTLPTGAKIEFEYDEFDLPKPCDFISDQPGIGGVPRHDDPERYKLRGVVKRTETDPYTNVSAETVYAPEAENRYNGTPGQSNCERPRWYKGVIEHAAGDSGEHIKIESWQSIATEDEGSWKAIEYGLAVNKDEFITSPESGEKLYLSERVSSCDGSNCDVIRETYVRFATRDGQDPSLCEVGDSVICARVDAPLVETLTRFLDDDSRGNVYKGVLYSDYDGLGHMRSVKNYSGGYDGSSESQTVYTRYNSNITSSQVTLDDDTIQINPSFYTKLPDSNDPWLLNLYDLKRVEQRDETIETDYCWTEEGLMRRADTHGLVTGYEYNAEGQLKTEKYYFSNSGGCSLASGAVKRRMFTYDGTYGHLEEVQFWNIAEKEQDLEIDGRGFPVSSTSPAGVKTTQTFDDLGRPTRIETDGGADPIQLTYSKASGSTSAKTTITQGDRTITVRYDGFGRPREETQSMPENQTKTTKLTRDALGQVTKVEVNDQTLTSRFDVQGRVTETTQFDGSKTTWTYTGNREREEVTGAYKTLTQYDAYGRIATVLRDDVSLRPIGDYCMSYAYDVGGRLIEVKRTPYNCSSGALPQVRSWEYNQQGFLTEEETPEVGKITYRSHDVFGNPGRVVNALYPELDHAYDEKGRLLSIKHFSSIYKEFTYGSDCSGDDKCLGRVVRAVRLNQIDGYPYEVAQDFTYEGTDGALSQVVTRVEYPGPDNTLLTKTFTQSYETDGQGRITDLTYPDCSDCGAPPSRTATYDYSHGFLTHVNGGSSDQIRASLAYNAYGFMNAVEYAGFSSVKTLYEPDNTGTRLQRIRVENGSETLWDTGHYNYNSAGLITKIGETTSYEYDGAQRLIGATVFVPGQETHTQGFTYNWFDNMITRTTEVGDDREHNSYFVDENTNQLYLHNQWEFSYDDLGRVYQDGCFEYTYDALNMITRVTPIAPDNPDCGDYDLTHFYDANDLRILSSCQNCPEPEPVEPGAGGGDPDGSGNPGGGTNGGGQGDPNVKVLFERNNEFIEVLEGGDFLFGENPTGQIDQTFWIENIADEPIYIMDAHTYEFGVLSPFYLYHVPENRIDPGQRMSFTVSRLNHPFFTKARLFFTYSFTPRPGGYRFHFYMEGGSGENPYLGCYNGFPLWRPWCGLRQEQPCWARITRAGGPPGPGENPDTLSPGGTLDLGSVPLGETAVAAFDVELPPVGHRPANCRQELSHVTLRLLSNSQSGDFDIQSFNRFPKPDDPSKVRIHFTPTSPGKQSEHLRFSLSTRRGFSTRTYYFSFVVIGVGDAAPYLRIRDENDRWMEAHERLEFGSRHVNDHQGGKRIKIENMGLAPMNNIQVTLDQPEGEPFKIFEPPPATLAPGGSHEFILKLKQGITTVGRVNAVLNIHHDAENLPNPLLMSAQVNLYTFKSGQTLPFTANAIPGRIQAEHFDQGADGWAYHDSDPYNLMSPAFRVEEGVDSGVVNDRTIVSDTRSGEWLEYTVQVANAGLYDLKLAYATDFPPNNLTGEVLLLIDESMIPITLNDTGAPYGTFTEQRLPGIFLDSGQQTIRLSTERGGYQLDWFEFTPSPVSMYVTALSPAGSQVLADETITLGETTLEEPLSARFFIHNSGDTGPLWLNSAMIAGDDWQVEGDMPLIIPPGSYNEITVTRLAQIIGDDTQQLTLNTQNGDFQFNVQALVEDHAGPQPFNGTPWAIPNAGIIRAWKYDSGSHERGHFDLTQGNQGDFIRPLGDGDWTDLRNDAQHGPVVTQIQASEWLAYSVNVATSGYYDLELARKGGQSAGASIGTVKFYLNEGADLVGSLDLGASNNGLSHVFLRNMTLPQGESDLRLVFEAPAHEPELLWFKITTAINPPDDPLLAVNDSYDVIQGTTSPGYNTHLMLNDLGGGVFDGIISQPPANTGTFSTTPNGFLFTPAAGFLGTTSFQYRIRRQTETSTARVDLTVLPPGSGPQPVDDQVVVPSTATTIVFNHFLLDNDHASNDPRIHAITQQASHGSAAITGVGHVNYVPNGNYSGPDSFQYNIRDQAGTGAISSTSATVSMTVVAPPVAVNDGPLQTSYQTPLIIPFENLLGNDEPHPVPVSMASFDFPNQSQWTADFATETVIYTPPNGFWGEVNFSYQSHDHFVATNDQQTSNSAQVTVEVLPPPVLAKDDHMLIASEWRVQRLIPIASLLANDFSELPLDIQSFTQPRYGLLTRLGDKLHLLLNRVNWSDPLDSFNYTAVTTTGETHTATAHIRLDATCQNATFEDFENDFSFWDGDIQSGGFLDLEPQAASEGNQGLAVHLPEVTNPIALVARRYEAESHYRISFNFDPNGIQMANGDQFAIFEASKIGESAFALQFGKTGEGYYLKPQALLDSNQWHHLPGFSIFDDNQTITLEWWIAQGPTISDGALKIYNNGILVSEALNLDNDQKEMNLIKMGALNGVDAGTVGSIYFDGFHGCRGDRSRTYIVKSDFEDQAFPGWNFIDGDVTINADAAISGDYGVRTQALQPSTHRAIVGVRQMKAFEAFSTEHEFDPNSLDLPLNRAYLMIAGAGFGSDQFQVWMQKVNGLAPYQLQLRVRADNGTWISGEWLPIQDASYRIWLSWEAASESSAADGWSTMVLEPMSGSSLVRDRSEITDVANASSRIEHYHFGLITTIPAGINGATYFDDTKLWIPPQ